MIEIIGVFFKRQNNNRNNKQKPAPDWGCGSPRENLPAHARPRPLALEDIQMWWVSKTGTMSQTLQGRIRQAQTDFPRPSDNGLRFHFRPVLTLFASSEKLVPDPSPLSQTARVSTCLCERVCVHEYSCAQTHTLVLSAY